MPTMPAGRVLAPLVYLRRRTENLHVEGLVYHGKRKRVGEGHRGGGAGRRIQRGRWGAPDGRTGSSGGAIWRAGEARETGSPRRSRGKSCRAVGSGHIRAAGRSGE